MQTKQRYRFFRNRINQPIALISLLLGLTLSTANAEIVDLPSSPIDRQGKQPKKQRDTLRQVQAQIPQPPAPVPLQTPNAIPVQPGAAPGAAALQNAPLPGLNSNPNANINELVQPTMPPASSVPRNFNSTRPALGAVGGSFSSAPNMIGDNFQGGLAFFQGSVTQSFTERATGTVLSGLDGSASSQLAFETGTDIVPNDFFSTGTGLDLDVSSDGFADTFAILEPLPPNDANTSPGPGFTFDGGTASFTGLSGATSAQPGIYTTGDEWFIAYSYTSSIGRDGQLRPVAGPGVSVRRAKLSENFSPEVRDRAFLSYNFFNDAFGGLGDISRYTLGLERILVDDLISIEARLPMAGTYASTQNLDARADRDFEIGNATFIGKAVLLRTDRFLWTGGMGLSIPTADDAIYQAGGQNILRIRNQTVHLLPFTAFMLRRNRDTTLQAYMQLDIAANDDSVFFDLAGGRLPKIGDYADSTQMHLDVSASRSLYRSCDRCARIQQVIGNAELHYTGSLEDSDRVRDPGGQFTYQNLQSRFNIVNATTGMHFVLGKKLVVTPAMTVPLTSGLDDQFDYEATVQLNYLR